MRQLWKGYNFNTTYHRLFSFYNFQKIYLLMGILNLIISSKKNQLLFQRHYDNAQLIDMCQCVKIQDINVCGIFQTKVKCTCRKWLWFFLKIIQEICLFYRFYCKFNSHKKILQLFFTSLGSNRENQSCINSILIYCRPTKQWLP